MSASMQKEYGKKELVELLTKVSSNSAFGWLENAVSAPLDITNEDMPKIHQAVLSYKANRIRCYGEYGAYTKYFMPAFLEIESAFTRQNFQDFKAGCEHLLGLISAD